MPPLDDGLTPSLPSAACHVRVRMVVRTNNHGDHVVAAGEHHTSSAYDVVTTVFINLGCTYVYHECCKVLCVYPGRMCSK